MLGPGKGGELVNSGGPGPGEGGELVNAGAREGR